MFGAIYLRCCYSLSVATTGVVRYTLDIMQSLDYDKSSPISKLIKENPEDLQKLLKYSNEKTTSLTYISFSVGMLHIILVLYLKDLLLVVLLLFVL